jgi:hypothetical protein
MFSDRRSDTKFQIIHFKTGNIINLIGLHRFLCEGIKHINSPYHLKDFIIIVNVDILEMIKIR